MLKIGDLVLCEVHYEKRKTDKPIRECFVEEVLTDKDDYWLKWGKGVQVSLYAVDGEYIGDYWESELRPLGRMVDVENLKGLIKKAVFEDHWGEVLDFVKVWLLMKEG
jgi:hypothetical protein